MSLSDVSLLFLLQTVLGSFATFVVNDRAALGPKYFKFAGWVVVALLGLAGWLVWGSGDPRLGWLVAATAGGSLVFASLSGWDRPGLETLALWATLLVAAAAVALSALLAGTGVAATTDAVASSGGALDAGLALDAKGWLQLASAAGSSAVLGFTLWGMILGHWYLVSQGLSIRHLDRLVAPLPWLFGAKAAISAYALWRFWPDVLGPGNANLTDLLERSPTGVLDVVNVWSRIPIGLLVPLVLALMTRVTVRLEKTQPATGILYAMCGLVISGELMGRMLEGGTGVPF